MRCIAVLIFICIYGVLTHASPEIEQEKAESQKFIEKEAKVPKTEQMLSGLLYRPIKVGKGDYPTDTSMVTVEYKGTLRNGKVFDQSPKGKPVSFSVNRVIPCWTEALKKMQVGGKAVIVCPSHIAYGDNDVGAHIKGGSALKFEVTLLKIDPF